MTDRSVSFTETLHEMLATAGDKIIVAASAGALLAPAWHGFLREASDASALIAPLLGCLVMAATFYAKTLEIRERKRRLDEDSDAP